MGLFGKSMEDKVQNAVEKVRTQFPNASVDAKVTDDVVTLTGHAPDTNTKAAMMAAFNASVETENTINQISIDKPAGASTGASELASTPSNLGAAKGGRVHEVASGETLTAIAHRYYGDASKYNRIFDANRDQLKDPDKIQVGQKLKIPE